MCLVWLTTACGDRSSGGETSLADGSVAGCGAPELVVGNAAPLEWIEIRGLPDSFGPAAAEVGIPGEPGRLIAPVIIPKDRPPVLRVPLHPSFRIEGGPVEVLLVSGDTRCDPLALTIDALEPAPGTMAETTSGLRAAVDEIAAPHDSGRLSEGLLTSGEPVPVLAIGALWALPELETLERLVDEDPGSPEARQYGATLDALAAHLELPTRMADLRRTLAAVRKLSGNPTVDPARRISAPEDASDSPFQLAARTAAPSPPDPKATTGGGLGSTCPTDRSNLFDISRPGSLDDLMRAQNYAERFLAGVNDEAEGSAAGTVFGDVGAVMEAIEWLGPQGETAKKIWEAFSSVVLTTSEAADGLLPNDLELAAVADPDEFEEDSEATGSWTATARASSKGMKLTERIIQKVMEKALEKGLADVSYYADPVDGDVSREAAGELSEHIVDKTSGAVDDALIKQPPKAALNAFLRAIGARETPDGFDIPGGCWEMDDMSASDPPARASADRPPLVDAFLTGESIEFVSPDATPRREYRPVEAGNTRLELRTVDGYRKAVEVVLGVSAPGIAVGGTTPTMTTYGFGGKQFVAATPVQVLPIQVEFDRPIRVVEPGEPIDFVVRVKNAVDGGVRFEGGPVGAFGPVLSVSEHEHHVRFDTPEDLDLYPITVRAISTSTRGARGRDDAPIREGTALLQRADPVLEVLPAMDCVRPGESRQLVANVYGVEDPEIAWEIRDGPEGGDSRVSQNGLFRAGRGQGTVRVYAHWMEDTEVRGHATIEVGPCENRWSVSIGGGPGGGLHSGSDGYVTIASRSVMDGGRRIREGQIMSIGLKTEPNPNAGGGNPVPGACPFVLLQPREDGVLPSTGAFMAKGSVTFGDCSGEFGNVMEGTGYELSNGAEHPEAPGPVQVSIGEVTDGRISGTFTGRFHQARHQSENRYIDYGLQFPVSGSFSLQVRDWP